MNELLISQFEKLVSNTKLELDNVNKKEKQKLLFKLKHFKNALNIIKKHPEPITSGKDLQYYHGIGKGIMNRIDEILQSGKLNELKNIIPNKSLIIDELETVSGIGRVKAKELVEKYNIKSVKDLQNKFKKNIIPLTRAIMLGLKYYDDSKIRIPRNEITKIYNVFRKIVFNIDTKLLIKVCGSYRRKKNYSKDIDILVTHTNIIEKNQINKNYIKIIIQKLKNNNNISLIDDIFEDYNITYNGYIKYKNNPVRRIDIKFVPYISWPTALLHYTGSGEFNQIMRSKAKQMNYKLNEYGLFNDNKRIPITSEKDIFIKLGMDYIPPSKRDIN